MNNEWAEEGIPSLLDKDTYVVESSMNMISYEHIICITMFFQLVIITILSNYIN